MSDRAAWDDLRVIHFDSNPPLETTDLAPWRTGLDGNYRCCPLREQFLAELHAPRAGAGIVLLHRTDLDQYLDASDLADWLDRDSNEHRPQHLILVYGNTWQFGDHTKTVTRLPARHASQRWYTFPHHGVVGGARPVAWLGHLWDLGLSLASVARHFDLWRSQAAQRLLPTRDGEKPIEYTKGAPEEPFLERVRRVVDQSGLDGWVDVGGKRSDSENEFRAQAGPRQLLLEYGDRLWLLEGVASNLKWQQAARLLNDVLAELTRLLRCGVELEDNERRGVWQETLRELRRLCGAADESFEDEEYNERRLWHVLKNARNEKCERALIRLGFGKEVRRYRALCRKEWEKAIRFAADQMWKAARGRSSRVLAHAALAATGSNGGARKKVIGVLLVDDQPKWGDHFKRYASSFSENDADYELDVRCVLPKAAEWVVKKKRGLQAIVLDYYLEAADHRDGTSSGGRSLKLATDIRCWRPDLPIFGLTGQSLPDVDRSWMVDRVFSKDDAAELHELFLAIVQSVRDRSRTPFFTGLRDYAARPVAVFHALPLSRAKSVAGSQWAREFAEFYGEGYFAGETSSTLAPLDSLFSPKHHLKDAMDLAAKAFGADRTLFVTNGTTGANSIVYQASLKPGDLVLLDRNCHRSHHYAAVQSGAHVVYMEPAHLHKYGISTLVPIATIESQVRNCKDAKMLVLTHPTFDGLCYNPIEIIARVHAINPRIVFLFDEAWFAYGFFHPKFRKYSTMAAVAKLRTQKKPINACVYVTQSIHKTLSAMRQASMIHIAGPKEFREKMSLALDESFHAHTTTSPNVHLLASLDAARMQAQMEGFDRLSAARSIAKWIRAALSSSAARPLELKDLAHELLGDKEMDLDPLKITLYCQGIAGNKLRTDFLYKHRGIQINKYSHNTVLVLVTIGTTQSMADHLVRSLRDWRPEFSKKLRLMSSMRDVSGIPTEGKDMIIVAAVDQVLHFRIFDADGKKVVDKDETTLTTQAGPIEDLRKQLESWWPPHELTESEKAGVITAVTSIVGQVDIPQFSSFAQEYQGKVRGSGDLAKAYYCALQGPDLKELLPEAAEGKTSATFVTPYPPGYPILVPGQVISKECVIYLDWLLKSGTPISDIHGLAESGKIRVMPDPDRCVVP